MRNTARCASIALALLMLASACTRDELPLDASVAGESDSGAHEDTGAPDVDASVLDEDSGRAVWMPTDHPIDVALWPRLVREGAPLVRVAGEDELCRRFAVELLGHVPTREERAALCAGRDAESMARAMMGEPAFVERERRLWIQRVGAAPIDMMATHLADADRIYDALARGELEYDDFVARLVAHPVLAVQRLTVPDLYDDRRPTVVTIFRLFLGRLPNGYELADFANLLRPWRRAFEPRCADLYPTWRRPAYLDPGVCPDPVLGEDGCASEALGARVGIAIPRDAAPYGISLDCEDATPRSDVYYYERFHGGTVPAAIQLELERPGRLLATRSELWDRAAELALMRLLGWWRSTADEPSSVLPEVLRVTAEWFRAQPRRDLRDLYAFILGSVLGTASSETEDGDAPSSLWSAGSTRWMDGNQYLDSLEAIFGRELGLCDPHTADAPGSYSEHLDRLRTPEPADYYGFGENVYLAWGQSLGGCRGTAPSPTGPGLEAVFAHPAIVDRICSLPDAQIAPVGFDLEDESDANVDRLAADLFDRMLLRTPSESESVAIREAAHACFESAGCDMAALVRETCTAIARSSAFTHY